jgi:ATP-dependent DNA helicase RecQ
MEAYYQEVGRAGRDGEPAHGLMMYTPSDIALRRRLLERGAEEGPDPDPAIVDHKWNLFLELIRWAEGGSCRHDAILRYFGDEAETLHGCGQCDVCRSIGTESQYSDEEVALFVRKALSGVARVHGKFGLGLAVKLLRGNKDDRLARNRLDQVSTFGILKDHSEAWVTKLVRRCVTAGWVDFHGRERPVVYLTEDGKAVMSGTRPARLLLPAEDDPVRTARASSGTKRKEAAAELDDEASVVFEALRRHRMAQAKKDGVPPYVVASDRTLRDIALLRPRSLEELAMAHGIGPAKLDKHGEDFLAVVRGARSGVT